MFVMTSVRNETGAPQLTHSLATHEDAPQLTPHAPQFAGSLVRSTQAPPQEDVPAAQVHAPRSQLSVAPHARSQVPQCDASVTTSTQAPPQF